MATIWFSLGLSKCIFDYASPKRGTQEILRKKLRALSKSIYLTLVHICFPNTVELRLFASCKYPILTFFRDGLVKVHFEKHLEMLEYTLTLRIILKRLILDSEKVDKS